MEASASGRGCRRSRDGQGRWPNLVGSGEQFAQVGHGLVSAPAVQEEEGSTIAVLVDGDVDRTDAIEIHRVGGGGHGVSAYVVAGTVA